MATTHQMAIRIIYLFVLFKGKLYLPKSFPVPSYKLLGWTYKAFVVTFLGVFTWNMALKCIRDLLGGANLENKERLWEMTSTCLWHHYLMCCVRGQGRAEDRVALRLAGQTPSSRRLSPCFSLPGLFKGTSSAGVGWCLQLQQSALIACSQ